MVNFCTKLNFSKAIPFNTFQDILNLLVVSQWENEFFDRQKTRRDVIKSKTKIAIRTEAGQYNWLFEL